MNYHASSCITHASEPLVALYIDHATAIMLLTHALFLIFYYVLSTTIPRTKNSLQH